ncbi:MAG: hypothetical protein ACFB4I_02840 [Cyanophyceae cyanobacterium]
MSNFAYCPQWLLKSQKVAELSGNSHHCGYSTFLSSCSGGGR